MKVFMADINITLNNFTSGEISPKLRGRIDLNLYNNGCEQITNFITNIQGSLTYRSGTSFIHSTRRNLESRLIPFEYGNGNGYILELTPNTNSDYSFIRFYKNEELILLPEQTITGITNATKCEIGCISHGLSNNDEIFIYDCEGLTELNNRWFCVSRAEYDTDKFTLNDLETNEEINSTNFGIWTSGGKFKKVFEVLAPYKTYEEIVEIQYSQNENTMYLVHKDYDVRELICSGDTSWAFDTQSRTSDPFTSGKYPSVVSLYESRLILGSTSEKPNTLWFSQAPTTASGVTNYDNFTTGADDDNALIFTLSGITKINWIGATVNFLLVGANNSLYKITGAGTDEPISPSSILIKPIKSFGCSDISPCISKEIIAFIEIGNTRIRTFEYNLEQDAYTGINRTILSDHITGNGVTQIVFQAGKDFDILWSIREDGYLIGLTYDINEKIASWHKHKFEGGEVEGIGVLTQTNGSDRLYLIIKRTLNGYTKRYIEYLEDYIIVPEIEDYFFNNNTINEEEIDTRWFLDEMYNLQKTYSFLDSNLKYNGYDRTENIILKPNAISGSDVDFSASSAVFISSDLGKEIWKKNKYYSTFGKAIITEVTNSTTCKCRIIEEFDSDAYINGDDWAIATNTISGLEHLRNEVVYIVVDGSYYGNEVVSNDGTVGLKKCYSCIIVGLKYIGIIKTNGLIFQDSEGVSVSKNKRVSNIGIKLLNSLGGKIGTSIFRLEPILDWSNSNLSDRPAPLFSGIKVIDYSKDFWNINKNVIILQDLPLPFNLQLIDIYIEVEGAK